ncbi:cyclodeaminase/cyclohydrolase family protein [Desulfosporosinus sp.]|uniref:cyclodeaminase/cyclohydrolase family protein n=1 Tax=Desulfosporosinus sp. TaxID=157907 RepID=UPI000E9815B7|nr:cyclodeaminase/cyclohydrolase family protein [Desulfosporosinus sp.]MBC2722370.1 cyclodeaminase/cyclohydrolase family protein [Desulfosporosinus sp.]MBC2726856.1 cyclodeaminase/cyclohydrolase family protein [Desulfosporosinus sp.]HBV89068.1 formimidoyltetrahydrofolate cyclodeaminase [Desulfosporosinus sp.]
MDMNKIWEWSTEEFLTVSASSSPTPGGGSVSAYVGALAASMTCMVANLTIGKEKYKEVEPEAKEILAEAETVLNNLKTGLSQDIAEFSNFMDVLKLPKGTDEEKAARAAKMQEVLVSATDTPLGISQNCFRVLQLAQKLAPIGNKGAISDVGVSAYLAESALKSAMLSVDINLPGIKDEAYQERVKAERARLFEQAAIICAETVAVVQSRM